MRLILIIVIILTLVLMVCGGCLPDSTYIYTEVIPYGGSVGTVQVFGAGVTYNLPK